MNHCKKRVFIQDICKVLIEFVRKEGKVSFTVIFGLNNKLVY